MACVALSSGNCCQNRRFHATSRTHPVSPVLYILVALTLTSAAIAVAFSLGWRYLGRKPHALSWSLAFVAATGQWLFTTLVNLFPSASVYWALVSALALLVAAFGLRGHLQRTHGKVDPRRVWWPAGLIYAGVLASTLVWYHAGLQLGLVTGAAALALFYSTFLVLRYREHRTVSDWGAAASMTVLGVIQVVATTIAMAQGAADDPVLLERYRELNFLTLPGGYVAIAMFSLFLLATDFSDEMRDLAVYDQLTGLLNRRGFGELGTRAYATARREHHPISIIVTDIDRFKDINDRYGHPVGDKVIAHFARLLTSERRAVDFAARLGGEEFALVLPAVDLTDAAALAQRLCDRVAAEPIPSTNGEVWLTASFGVATLSAEDSCLSDAILRADHAVYASKRNGRNQVTLEARDNTDLTLPAKTATGF